MILGLKINFTLRKSTDNCGSQENMQHCEFENKIKNDLRKKCKHWRSRSRKILQCGVVYTENNKSYRNNGMKVKMLQHQCLLKSHLKRVH